MEKLVTTDLGPGVDGWVARIDGDIVCVATPRVEHDPRARREVRRLVTRVGGDCGTCRGCIIGLGVA